MFEKEMNEFLANAKKEIMANEDARKFVETIRLFPIDDAVEAFADCLAKTYANARIDALKGE